MTNCYRFSIASIALAFLGIVLWPVSGMSYDFYNGTPGCDDCHPGFVNKGPLHSLHVGNQQMTGNCQLCHTSPGDNPSTSSSKDGVGCMGCHMGPGLRAHHTNAGAPPDQGGLTCIQCHSADPIPPAEIVAPPYYLRSDVNVKNPCTVAFPDGEDVDGDGAGLDNDGDLMYDQNDPDCGSTPVEPTTWSCIKALYLE